MKSCQYIITLFLFSFLSCEYVTERIIDYNKPSAVLNAIARNDSVFTVSISQTFNGVGGQVDFENTGNYDDLFINDALVSLTVNGILKGKMNYSGSKGKYNMPDYFPEEEDIIELYVETDKYEPLSTQIEIPQKPIILEYDTIMIKGEIGEYWNTNQMGVNIKFQDPGGSLFYLITCSGMYTYQDKYQKEDTGVYTYFSLTDKEVNMHHQCYRINSYVFPFHKYCNGYNSVTSQYFIFSNELFKGKDTDLNIMMDYVYFSYYDDDISFTQYYQIHLHTITDSFYYYLRSKYIQNEDGGFLNDLKEPIPSFTNIEGGYGLFAGYSESKIMIEMLPQDDLPYISAKY